MRLSCYHKYIRDLYNLIVGFRLATADIFQIAGSWILESCSLVLFIMKFRKKIYTFVPSDTEYLGLQIIF